jgi:hypothetical protein
MLAGVNPPVPATPRPRSAWALGAVAVLHVGLGAALLQIGLAPERQPVPADRPALWITLPAGSATAPVLRAGPERAAAPAPRSPAAAPAAQAGPPGRPRPAGPAPAVPRVAPPSLPDSVQAITLPPAAEPGPAPAAAASAVASPPALAPDAAPLNLALPRHGAWRGTGGGGSSRAGMERNPALDDPRSNSRPLTLEQRIADATGASGEPWVEEAIDADHRRLRRGNTCVTLQRSRLAQIDPFSSAARNLPWQVGQPTRCAGP